MHNIICDCACGVNVWRPGPGMKGACMFILPICTVQSLHAPYSIDDAIAQYLRTKIDSTRFYQ